MNFRSLQPFVPSGPDFEKAKQFFMELGFELRWDSDGYAGLGKQECGFILQEFNNREFAENFMLSVAIDDADAFRSTVLEKGMQAKYGVRIGEVAKQPYGREVNIIDAAGVCWHFVQAI